MIDEALVTGDSFPASRLPGGIAHPGLVHLLVKHGDTSFRSDHAAAAFAIAGVLFSVHRRLGTLALALAALVAYARVYVGDHYPGDVAGGALIGVAAAILVLTWLRTLPLLTQRLLDAVLVRLRLLPSGA